MKILLKETLMKMKSFALVVVYLMIEILTEENVMMIIKKSVLTVAARL